MADIIYANPDNDDIILNEEDEIAAGDDADCECCEPCDCETQGPIAGPFGVQISADPAGEGCCVQFTSSDSVAGECGAIVSWEWDFGDGTTSTEPDPIHCYTSFPEVGYWTVTLTVTDARGCTDTAELPFACGCNCTENAPIASFSFIQYDDDPCCFDFFDESEGYLYCGTIVEWEWDFGDGTTSTEENPTHCYDAEDIGPWSVTLTVTDESGCQDSIIMIVDCLELIECAEGCAYPVSGRASLTVSGLVSVDDGFGTYCDLCTPMNGTVLEFSNDSTITNCAWNCNPTPADCQDCEEDGIDTCLDASTDPAPGFPGRKTIFVRGGITVTGTIGLGYNIVASFSVLSSTYDNDLKCQTPQTLVTQVIFMAIGLTECPHGAITVPWFSTNNTTGSDCDHDMTSLSIVLP